MSVTQDAVLAQTHPEERDLPPTAQEGALRALYAHEPGVVRLGLIQSADGKAAGPDGSSRSLNGPEDLRVLRVLRANADVVVVGGRTTRGERYRDVAVPAEFAIQAATSLPGPDLAIVTYTGVIPEELSPERTWIVTTSSAPAATASSSAWADRILVTGDDSIDPDLLREALAARGLARVLCEGGPELAHLFVKHDAIDDYCLTTSNRMGGLSAPKVPAVPAHMQLTHRLKGGGFVMERFSR
ncbi:MAG: deaminase [Actinobacteria bacterium HGW-Actinobacteria-4]|nr:MAG: deaminase [Actinobacteria bacterium HGW-Actinobacteria-4]